MFETSVVRDRVVARRRFTVLSVSVAAHTTAIIGGIAISVATVDFPSEAPRQSQLAPRLEAVSVPPPIGNRDGGARPQNAPQQPRPAPAPQQITAPSVVPDNVAAVPTSTPGEIADANATGTGTEPGPIGVPDGDPNSVATDLGLPASTSTDPPAAEQVYQVGGNVKAPRVISRVEPRYPPAMVMARKGATVRMLCIIDRNGNVREAEIVYSSFPAFNDSALAAVRQWRFVPGSMNGVAVDTQFELTVNFQVMR